MRIAFFGSFDPGYPRVRVFREGLESQGIEVRDLPSLGAWAARGRGIDALLVPAFGHRDVPLARALGRLAGIPVLFDPLVSRWDTQVGDLGRVRRGGFTAARLAWSDRLSLRLSHLVLCDPWEHAALLVAGASPLTAVSPVSRPTLSGPSWRQRSKNFSDTSAFTGAVYQLRPPPVTERAWAARATRDLPDPVGVPRITFDPASSSRIASSWWG